MRGFMAARWARFPQPKPEYRSFQPLIPDVSCTLYSFLLEEALDDTIAAVLEVVQVRAALTWRVIGGNAAVSAESAARCSSSTRCRPALAAQAVCGLTHYGLEPDMMCMAKGIAGGLPMGATLLSSRVQNIRPGVHGSTFGCNPLACAAALTVLDIIHDEGLIESSARKGAWALERLQTINAPLVREVRGLGMMIGIELRQKATPVLKALMAEGGWRCQQAALLCVCYRCW